MPKLTISGEQFLYDGKPFRILSGAVHYFRVVPEYWEDRLKRLRACGLNTVETYVAWNLHEPHKGDFRFEGATDLAAFIRLAGSLGLKVIVRPGPYICAEWEFGGLPSWLLGEPGLELRCLNKPYLDRVDAYLDAVMAQLRPLLCTNGGPVIALQVENEYGSYGDDGAYLDWLRRGLLRRGADTLLFTSDGPTDRMLSGGTLPDVFKTVNFGSGHAEALAKLAEHQPDGPRMCMEFWDGWFDHWGDAHIVRAPGDAAAEYEGMLRAGMSVNLYMLHGGTNFGFMNGANYADAYQPTVTSYDYDAPVSEEGDLTEKFRLFREAVKKATGTEPPAAPAPLPRKAFGTVKLGRTQPLFACLDVLSKPVRSAAPLPMEAVGQSYGYILYRTRLTGPCPECKLTMHELHDRAQIYLDGASVATVYRNDGETAPLAFGEGEHTLDILVENMGRINYGPRLHERKGITEYISLDYQKHFGWEIYPLELDDLAGLPYAGTLTPGAPAFYRGEFTVDEPADTYFDSKGWKRGAVFVNGFNIGRYWEAGPQRTLYIPAPLLRKGANELIVFDSHGCREAGAAEASLTDTRDLG